MLLESYMGTCPYMPKNRKIRKTHDNMGFSEFDIYDQMFSLYHSHEWWYNHYDIDHSYTCNLSWNYGLLTIVTSPWQHNSHINYEEAVWHHITTQWLATGLLHSNCEYIVMTIPTRYT